MKKSAGSSSHYSGPGSSLRQNNKVGVGQAAPSKPKMKEESKAHEKAESKSKEKKEEMVVGSGKARPPKTSARPMPPKGPQMPPPQMSGPPPMPGMGGPPPMGGMPGGAIPPAGQRPSRMGPRSAVPTPFRRGK